MCLNVDKLEVLTFSVRNYDSNILRYNYVAKNNVSIKHVSSSKDLGVVFDHDGTFSSHITIQCSKATKICGYILRTFISRDQAVLITLFKTLVLPILEYGCILWHPHYQYDINNLEEVQRAFTRKIKGLSTCNYWERLKALNIFSLERRRERYIILYTFKIIFGTVPNPGISWCRTITRRGRLIDVPKLKSSVSHKGSTLKYYSFRFVCARLFNCLPLSIRNFEPVGLNPIDLLKLKLDASLHTLRDEPRLNGYAGCSQSLSNRIYDQ